MKRFLSGDEAFAEGVRLARPQVISAYPIPPQTVVVERLSEMVEDGSLAEIRQYAKFNYGVGMMPYDADVKGAPQNAIIGGASLWVMQGKDKETYTGVAKFLDFLTKPENAAEWHQKTGYLPITTAAYDLTRQQGFYDKNPGADIATRQMLNKPPLPFTKGLRLGNMPQIRTIVDEELESVWTGKKTPQQALDSAVQRGNQLLRRFEQATKS